MHEVAMTDPKSGHWTRRRLLQTLPAILSPMLVPAELRFAVGPTKVNPTKTAPFSRFVDVTSKAGLTQTMFYADPDHNTYIIEANGAGCAFFDYDNDGWMDIFLLSGTRLEGDPPEATNRLYKNNRDGTFTDVTEKAGLRAVGWANGVCVAAWKAFRQAPATASTTTTVMAHSPMSPLKPASPMLVGHKVCASATTTTMALRICTSPTTGKTASTATMETAHSLM